MYVYICICIYAYRIGWITDIRFYVLSNQEIYLSCTLNRYNVLYSSEKGMRGTCLPIKPEIFSHLRGQQKMTRYFKLIHFICFMARILDSWIM